MNSPKSSEQPLPRTHSFPNTLIVITGPTASGKTELAIRLAQRLCCEIISADSRQFYREMKIGTAPPTPEELSLVRHHFIHSHSIDEPLDVSLYEKEALHCLGNLWKKHRFAVLVGGSGLYLRAVCQGLDELPDADPVMRKQLDQILAEKGIGELRLMLKKLDPDYYAFVDLANPKRLLRALEVCLSTGLPYSRFRKNESAPRLFNILQLGLDRDRAVLHRRIDQRTDLMMRAGLEEEARALFPRRHLNALNTVGYRELFDYFEGKCTREFAVEKIKTNTRRYARRQLTWFRKDKEIQWIDGNTPEDDFAESLRITRSYGCDIPPARPSAL